MVHIFKDEAVIFDLDDLLYKEFDFLRSAYWSIARLVSKDQPKTLFRLMMAQYFSGNAAIDWLIKDYLKGDSEYDLNYFLGIYRNHMPDISLEANVYQVLSQLKANGNLMGVLTDGRSITQRNKIKALNLNYWISDFCISEELGFEKPAKEPFLHFMEKFDTNDFVYIADNYNKDFIMPNELGWRTIALADNGLNIHKPNTNLPSRNLPGKVIKNFSELIVSNTRINDSVFRP